MKHLILTLAASSLLVLFAACGQSGPLYLPGSPSKIQNVPSTPDNAEEEDAKNKEENSETPEG